MAIFLALVIPARKSDWRFPSPVGLDPSAPCPEARGWMRTQLWKVRGGRTRTVADRVRGHAATVGEPLPEHIERQLRLLTVVIAEVEAADYQLRTLAGEHVVCRRLITVPGIGPLTALRFVAAIDDPGRVATAHRGPVVSRPHAGRALEFGARAAHGITKADPMELRRTLIQGAWAAMCLFSVGTSPSLEARGMHLVGA